MLMCIDKDAWRHVQPACAIVPTCSCARSPDQVVLDFLLVYPRLLRVSCGLGGGLATVGPTTARGVQKRSDADNVSEMPRIT